MNRCHWAETNELLAKYHDEEWGEVVHDDRTLFELLNLEGAQAGLSWLTVLRKRDAYRKAFDRFVAKKIVKYGAAKKRALMNDAGIVRNRAKIDAVISNARAFLEVQRELGSFDSYLWSFSGGRPTTRAKATEVSEQMSKALKKRGFKFVGPTICYAFMQAVGILDDHSSDCFRARR